MPELPEVETLRRGLEQALVNQIIIGATVANAKVLKEQTVAAFCERSVGRRIAQVNRRGKYLLLPLICVSEPQTAAQPLASDNQPISVSESCHSTHFLQNPDTTKNLPFVSLCLHLKMRGQLLLEPANQERGRYHCVSLTLGDGNELRFYDMWTWGECRALTPTEIAQIPGLATMAEEPLEASWDADKLEKRLRKRRSAIKPTLLDQTVVAGIGNIYADESLFHAGIHPSRPAHSLSTEEIERLVRAIQTVLQEAVSGGGTTSDEYKDLSGQPGRYVPKVYARAGKPCTFCATPLQGTRLGGRSTVYCSRCQP